MKTMIWRLLAVLLLGWSAGLACAQSGLQCAVCHQSITGQYHLMNSPALAEKTPVCDSCIHLENICFICTLPVKDHFQKLEDGRFLCDEDARSAVVTQADADKIWEETRRDLTKIFSGFGTMPRDITVCLVDQTQLSQAYKKQVSWHDKSTTLGLTRTRMGKEGELEHTVYLLSGLNPARLAAVCAHEHTHAWLHENVSRERNLDRDTVEGFCELAAYKLMTERNEAVEKKVILANTYTQGQIHNLIKAEDDYQFHRVIDWMKTGVNDRLSKENMTQVLKLKEESPLSALWYPQALPTVVPATLTLKGISGTSKRRFALINDCTLEKNEMARVRVGTTNVMVRCLEISDRSVLIQTRGSNARIELSLREVD